jgi:lactoylglutathione lyase
MIRIKNLEETLDFYTQFIGLREVRRSEIGDEALLVFLTDDAGQYHIELTLNHDRTDYDLGDQFGHLAFFTDDLERVVEDVESRGWTFRRSKPGMRSKYIFVKDPNGYDVEILERKG